MPINDDFDTALEAELIVNFHDAYCSSKPIYDFVRDYFQKGFWYGAVWLTGPTKCEKVYTMLPKKCSLSGKRIFMSDICKITIKYETLKKVMWCDVKEYTEFSLKYL